MSFHTRCVTHDGDEPLHKLRSEAEGGCAGAQYELACRYGDGVERDLKKSVSFLQKAIKNDLDVSQNIATAQTRIAVLYELGLGVRQNKKLARLWREKAAAQNEPYAQHALGLCFYSGKRGIPQNYERAFHFFEAAAKQGHAESIFCIGLMCQHGRGIQKDSEQAKKWYTEAANAGSEPAGRCLENLDLDLCLCCDNELHAA